MINKLLVRLGLRKPDYHWTETEMNWLQIKLGLHRKYDPGRYDFRWSRNYRRVLIAPLRWWDTGSYIEYQSADGADQDTIIDGI